MAMTLVTTNTSSGAATSDFTSSIDSTYKLYIFKFVDVNPATDDVNFGIQGNASDATGYNETMTTTYFDAGHDEDDSPAALAYATGHDQASGTAFQTLAEGLGNGGDESCAGTLWLFNPSNTTYVTHFYSRFSSYKANNIQSDTFVSGFFDTATAIDDIQFKMSSGNMDGIIRMYGVTTS
jgi:hypothetical protein